MNFFIKQLTPDQIVEKEKEFQEILSDVQKTEDTWEELNNFFKTATYFDVEKFWDTYWKWFVYLTWISLRRVDKNFFVDVAIKQQIPMAILLGFNVWSEIMWYLTVVPANKPDLKVVFGKARAEFFESQAFVGKLAGKSILLSDIIKEVKKNEVVNADSLANAEFKAKLRTILSSNVKNENDYPFLKLDEAVIKLLNLIYFFIAIDAEKIESILFLFRNPEFFESEEGANFFEEQNKNLVESKSLVSEKNVLKETVEPSEEQISEQQEPAETSESAISESLSTEQKNQEIPDTNSIPEPVMAEETPEQPEEPQKTKPSMLEIKQMLESRFNPNGGGINNIEGVLSMLGSFAEEYNDEKIAELYYFDETAGEFVWNKDLLGE